MTMLLSRRLCVSRSFSEPITTSSAVPAASPLSVRNCATTATIISSVTPTFANELGSRNERSSDAKRQPTQRAAVALVHSGTRSMCRITPKTRAAEVQMSGASDSPFLPRIGGVLLETMHCERNEALVPMLGSAIRLEETAGHREGISLAAALGVDNPSRELFESRFDVELRELREVEHTQIRAQDAVLLHQQRRTARVRFPRHLPRRISFAEGAQPVPLVRACNRHRARAALFAAFGRHWQRAERARIHRNFDGCVHPGPGP